MFAAVLLLGVLVLRDLGACYKYRLWREQEIRSNMQLEDDLYAEQSQFESTPAVQSQQEKALAHAVSEA